jgi:hypothetical protein
MQTIQTFSYSRAIFTIDNLEINNLRMILDIFRYNKNGLLFVIVSDESDLNKYNFRKYVNLLLL